MECACYTFGDGPLRLNPCPLHEKWAREVVAHELKRMIEAADMDWQPIETAPRGVEVLLVCPADGRFYLNPRYGVGVVTDHMGVCDWLYTHAPTHWMRLPNAPSRGDEREC